MYGGNVLRFALCVLRFALCVSAICVVNFCSAHVCRNIGQTVASLATCSAVGYDSAWKANARLGRAIARVQSSLAAECKNIVQLVFHPKLFQLNVEAV